MRVSPEKDKRLVEKYPKIFDKRNDSKYPISYGFSCDDGWFNILDGACSLIQSRCDRIQRKEGKDIQVVAIQVKEKFGSLRFYTTGGDDYTSGIIAMAECLSSKICERCGDTGELYTNGWWVTQCETCRKKYFETRSKSTDKTEAGEI